MPHVKTIKREAAWSGGEKLVSVTVQVESASGSVCRCKFSLEYFNRID